MRIFLQDILQVFLLFSVGLLVFYYFLFRPLIVNVEKREDNSMPEAVKNFPVHLESPETRNKTKEKVKSFLVNFDSGSVEISLSSEEINSLGTEIHIGASENFLTGASVREHYEVKDNYIKKQRLIYPDSFSLSGYSKSVDHLFFETKGGKILEVTHMVESSPMTIQQIFQRLTGLRQKYSLRRSEVVWLVFKSGLECGYSANKINNMITKIGYIGAQNGLLTIKKN